MIHLQSAVSGMADRVANASTPVEICSGPRRTAQMSVVSPSLMLYTVRSKPIRISADTQLLLALGNPARAHLSVEDSYNFWLRAGLICESYSGSEQTQNTASKSNINRDSPSRLYAIHLYHS